MNVLITVDKFGFGGTFGRTLFLGTVFVCAFTSCSSSGGLFQSCFKFVSSAHIFSNLDISYSKSLKNKPCLCFLTCKFLFECTLIQNPWRIRASPLSCVLRALMVDWHNDIGGDGCSVLITHFCPHCYSDSVRSIFYLPRVKILAQFRWEDVKWIWILFLSFVFDVTLMTWNDIIKDLSP